MNTHYTTFAGDMHLITGDLETTVRETYEYLNAHKEGQVLIFDNTTGKQTDFNFHGSLEEVLQRALPPEPQKGPGRPRLGVVNGEISLLPRHWEWLQSQSRNASGTIRILVENAKKNAPPDDRIRQSIDAAGSFMWAIAGNLPEFEEASRALYAKKWPIFDILTASWPGDIRTHLNFLLMQARNPFLGGNASHLKILDPLKDEYKDGNSGKEPWEMSATHLVAAISGGRFTVTQVIESSIQRISKVNGTVNAITAMMTGEAMASAAEIDRQRASGKEAGPLVGVPFTVKENLDVKGYPTTHGISAMKEATAVSDCPIVRRLRAAGAIPTGHTNLPDMSLRFHTCSQLYGATVNPWNTAFTPGGSSGGEGVAVATGMSAIGIGNDAGGSLRIPALFNGVAALKPGYGRFPGDHSVGPRNLTFASQVIPVDGFIARSVTDLHLAFQIAAGPDPVDPRTVPAPLFYEKQETPLKVAVVTNPGGLGVDRLVAEAVEQAAEILSANGYITEPVDLPFIPEITAAYGKLIMTEFYQSLPLLQKLLGPEGRKYIEFAMEVTKPEELSGYLQLTAQRQGFQREWAQFFVKYPLVLGPVFTRKTVSPGYDIKGIDEYRDIANAMRLCSASSFIGVPAVAVPTGIKEYMPVGVQLIGGMYREDLCLEAAAVIEAAVGVFTPINPG